MPKPQIDPAIERARSLIGVRFRPQGRSARFGLDCIGLAVLAHDIPLALVRSDYRLRGAGQCDVETALECFFKRIDTAAAQPGDLLLVEPGLTQLHLLILTAGGYIHADAGLRRVVEVPGAQPFRLLSAWRRGQSQKEG